MIASRMKRQLSELGIRKAFGASKTSLLLQVFWENLFLTGIGGLFGLLLSYLIVYCGRNWLPDLLSFSVDVMPEGVDSFLTPGMLLNPVVIGITFMVSLVLNVLSALIPALHALKKDIVYSLNEKDKRYEPDDDTPPVVEPACCQWMDSGRTGGCDLFLWGVVDPVYVLLSDKALPDHYDLTDTYLLSIGEYSTNHTKYKPEMASDSLKRIDFMRIVDQVRRYPGVSNVTVSLFNSYPQSGGWNGGQVFNDTILAYSQQMTFLSGTDYFGVFRIHDARTGQIPPVLAEGEQGIYLTPDLAEKLFGEKYPQNKWVHWGDTTRKFPLTAIIDPVQIRSNNQPGPLIFKTTSELKHLPGRVRICFRVRDGLASPVFTETFKREMRPRMQIGNYYLASLTDFRTESKNFEYYMGTTGTIRLQTILALFFCCVSFWGWGVPFGCVAMPAGRK